MKITVLDCRIDGTQELIECEVPNNYFDGLGTPTETEE